MSASIVRLNSPRIIIPAPWLKERDEQRKRKRRRSTGLSAFTASIKASLVGAVGMFILFLAGLIPFEFLALLVIPGFIVLFLSVGMLASIFAENVVKDYRQAGEVGWMAGFWTGVHGGNMAMMMAATGIYMNDFGQNVVNQLTVEQLESFAIYGFDQSMLALTARVLGALCVYGVIGGLIAALFGTIGGMLYLSLTTAEN